MAVETIQLLAGVMALFLLVLIVLRRRRRRALTRDLFRRG
jgi:LPXTG-motif cell wall-anchored protein